jgi:transcriptional regulator with XRE-family HTH domain
MTNMTSRDNINELGEFLKARRAELSPRTLGLPETGGPRRVAGLRREEVALLATISTDYYTRLEQGRIEPSASVLAALARVLHLGDDQRDHLLEIAGKKANRPRRRAAQKVRPQLQRLLDDLTSTPALVMGRRMDILAWNSLAAALFVDFAKIPEKKRNYVRLLFTESFMKSLHVDWESVARGSVAQLRMEAARYPDDTRLAALVGELSVRGTQFRQWWGAHHVAARTVGTKTFKHPVVGDLTLDGDTFACSTDADQQLVIWTAAPGTPSYEGLCFLASWVSNQPGTTN